MTAPGNPEENGLSLAPPNEMLSVVTASAATHIGAAALGEGLESAERPADRAALATYLDGRASFLLAAADKTSIETYAGLGLHIAAQRMDLAQGTAHEAVVKRLFEDPAAGTRFLEGRQTILKADQARSQDVKALITSMTEHMSFHLTEPSLVHGVLGLTYDRSQGTRRIRAARPFLASDVLTTMKDEKWSPELQALTMALAMQGLAMRKIRAVVNPGLRQLDLLPRTLPGREEGYWRVKLFGDDDQEGIFYYLGYIEKSRAVIKRRMLELWEPKDYERNRQVLISALSLRSNSIPGVPSQRKEKLKLWRHALFNEIGRGDFGAAAKRLRLIAQLAPEVLPPLSYDYFKPENLPSRATGIGNEADDLDSGLPD